MPATPNFAIPYPCSGDTIDAAAIQAWADGIDLAVSSVQDQADLALNRPSLYVQSPPTGQAYATGVAADISFSTATFARGSYTFTLPTTTITVNTPGIYRMSGQISMMGSLVTTTTRWRVELRAGTQLTSRLVNFGDLAAVVSPLVAEGLFIVTAGTVVTLNLQWIGTGGPTTAFGTLAMNKISDL